MITRHQLARVAAASGIALAALTLGAPAASAEPAGKPIKEGTIKSECKAAGGTYGTQVVDGTRFSSCRYKDNEGNKYVDFYLNGGYYATNPD